MNLRRLLPLALVFAGVAAVVLPTAGCGSQVQLDKVVQIADSQSGYVDLGLVNGKTRLVPSATVRVKNIGTEAIPGFQLSASFWRIGEDGQKDELMLPTLVAKDLAPGAVSDPISIRANFGYTLEGARADFFTHSQFVDFTIKVFGKINGRIYRVGEVKVDRKILTKDGSVPIA